MRGHDEQQASMFSYFSPERQVPQDHPLRPIRAMVETLLADLSPRFALLYSHTGHPSIPPEKLLRALLLKVLFTVRSEGQLMEQLDYNLLLRWFVGLNMDDPVWHVTVFTKNRDRLLAGDIAQAFFDRVLARTRDRDVRCTRTARPCPACIRTAAGRPAGRDSSLECLSIARGPARRRAPSTSAPDGDQSACARSHWTNPRSNAICR